MKKFYYVGVFLKEKILFGLYGFTDYADCCTEAENPTEAQRLAKSYFESKYKVEVTGTRPTLANKKYLDPDHIIKTVIT